VMPVCANTCAMPLPIVPAPTTPTELMSAISEVGGQGTRFRVQF
jgi:hypothetical protein